MQLQAQRNIDKVIDKHTLLQTSDTLQPKWRCQSGAAIRESTRAIYSCINTMNTSWMWLGCFSVSSWATSGFFWTSHDSDDWENDWQSQWITTVILSLSWWTYKYKKKSEFFYWFHCLLNHWAGEDTLCHWTLLKREHIVHLCRLINITFCRALSNPQRAG